MKDAGEALWTSLATISEHQRRTARLSRSATRYESRFGVGDFPQEEYSAFSLVRDSQRSSAEGEERYLVWSNSGERVPVSDNLGQLSYLVGAQYSMIYMINHTDITMIQATLIRLICFESQTRLQQLEKCRSGWRNEVHNTDRP